MADSVLVGDRDGNIVICNPAAQRLMNIAAGMTPAQWTHAQEIFMDDGVTPMPLEQRPLMRAVRGEAFENYGLVVRYPHARKPITFVATGGPIRGGARNRPRAASWSIATSPKREEIERQLRQSQKMEAVGQLTGGIAHDFNNILTVITGTIEILGGGVADRPELAAIAKMIDEAAERGAELTAAPARLRAPAAAAAAQRPTSTSWSSKRQAAAPDARRKDRDRDDAARTMPRRR